MKIKYLAAIAATTSVLSIGLLTSCGPEAAEPVDPAADPAAEPVDPAADPAADPCAAPVDPAADPCAAPTDP